MWILGTRGKTCGASESVMGLVSPIERAINLQMKPVLQKKARGRSFVENRTCWWLVVALSNGS